MGDGAEARSRYDRWRDVDENHIPVGCRIEQVALAKEHGAISRRFGRQGVVVGRTHSRLRVRFDGEAKPVTIRPFVVRVVPAGQGGRPVMGRWVVCPADGLAHSPRVACQTCVVAELVSARFGDLGVGGPVLVGDRPRWVRDSAQELLHLVAPGQFAVSVGGAVGRTVCGQPVAGMDSAGLASGLCVRCVSALLSQSDGRV